MHKKLASYRTGFRQRGEETARNYFMKTFDDQKKLKFSTAEERTAEVVRLTEELSISNGYMRMLWVRYDEKVRLLSPPHFRPSPHLRFTVHTEEKGCV